jgi:hypothetical protein
MKRKSSTDPPRVTRHKGRKFIFLSFLFFLPAAGFAQRFDAGITVGAIASQVSGDRLAGYDKPGFEVGGLVTTSLSEKFDLSFQILYVQKGSRKNPDPDRYDYSSYKMRLGYIEVPLQVQYYLSERFRLEAGTAVGFLMSYHEEDDIGDLTGVVPRKDFRRLEWSVLGSLNYLLGSHVYLILGAENSVLPIRTFEPGAVRLDRDQYNSLIRFSIRYIFKSGTGS